MMISVRFFDSSSSVNSLADLKSWLRDGRNVREDWAWRFFDNSVTSLVGDRTLALGKNIRSCHAALLVSILVHQHRLLLWRRRIVIAARAADSVLLLHSNGRESRGERSVVCGELHGAPIRSLVAREIIFTNFA